MCITLESKFSINLFLKKNWKTQIFTQKLNVFCVGHPASKCVDFDVTFLRLGLIYITDIRALAKGKM